MTYVDRNPERQTRRGMSVIAVDRCRWTSAHDRRRTKKIVMGSDIVMEIDITHVEVDQVIYVEERESVE